MFIGGCHEALRPAPSHLTNMGYDRKHHYGALRFWIHSHAQRPHLTKNVPSEGTKPRPDAFFSRLDLMEVFMHRRRVVQTVPLIERLDQEAQRIREELKKLRPGRDRQEMLRKARQAEIAASITKWISSPGLKPPE